MARPIAVSIFLSVLPAVIAGCNLGQDIQLGTLLHVWYGFDSETGDPVGGRGSSHWDPTVVVEPEPGFYSSDDKALIKWQINQMRATGVTWVLVSWFGPGKAGTPAVSPEGSTLFAAYDRATKRVMEHLLTLDGQVRATILVEPWPRPEDADKPCGDPDAPGKPPVSLTVRDKSVIWEVINRELYRPYKEVWFEWQGKPLVVGWMPMDIGLDERFTYRRLSVYHDKPDPEVCPMDWNAIDGTDPTKYESLISEDGFRKVSPRLNWLLLQKQGWRPRPVQIDPCLEEGWYDSQWESIFDHREKVKLILVWTWNEYHEQNFIEPTLTGPSIGSSRLLLDKTGYYFERLRAGQSFKRHTAPELDFDECRGMMGRAG